MILYKYLCPSALLVLQKLPCVTNAVRGTPLGEYSALYEENIGTSLTMNWKVLLDSFSHYKFKGLKMDLFATATILPT